MGLYFCSIILKYYTLLLILYSLCLFGLTYLKYLPIQAIRLNSLNPILYLMSCIIALCYPLLKTSTCLRRQGIVFIKQWTQGKNIKNCHFSSSAQAGYRCRQFQACILREQFHNEQNDSIEFWTPDTHKYSSGISFKPIQTSWQFSINYKNMLCSKLK